LTKEDLHTIAVAPHRDKRTLKEKASCRRIKATIGGLTMSRSYTHVRELEEEIFKQKAEGKSNREIREQYGLSEKQMKNLITRHNKSMKLQEAGILSRRRGRLPRNHKLTEDEKDNEIKRLKMENELLRDFLRAAGRR
jgi:DNA-binding CsgD family transcriptional regulator